MTRNFAKEALEKRAAEAAALAPPAPTAPPVTLAPVIQPAEVLPVVPVPMPSISPIANPAPPERSVFAPLPPVTPTSVAPQPITVQPTAPPSLPVQPDARLQEELARAQSQLELERLARQADKTRMDQLAADAKTLKEIQTQQEIDAALNFEGIENDAFSGADIKPFVKPVYEALYKQQQNLAQNLEARIAKQEELIAQQASERQNALAQSQAITLQSQLRAAVPSIDQLEKSPEFKAFLDTPVFPGATLSHGQVIATEYRNGNINFVANAIKQFIQGGPSLENVVQVNSANIATTVAPVVDAKPADELRAELLAQVRTGQISRQQYRERINQARSPAAP